MIRFYSIQLELLADLFCKSFHLNCSASYFSVTMKILNISAFLGVRTNTQILLYGGSKNEQRYGKVV